MHIYDISVFRSALPMYVPSNILGLFWTKYPIKYPEIIFKRSCHLSKHAINFQTSMKIRTDCIFTYSLLLAKRTPKFYNRETDSLGVACQLCPPTEGEGTYSICVSVGVGGACCLHLSSEPIRGF